MAGASRWLEASAGKVAPSSRPAAAASPPMNARGRFTWFPPHGCASAFGTGRGVSARGQGASTPGVPAAEFTGPVRHLRHAAPNGSAEVEDVGGDESCLVGAEE